MDVINSYLIMIHNIFKKIFVQQYHLDITLLLLIIMILIYSIFILWSASGQNISMMYNKIIQIIIGLLVMFILARVPPRIYETWSPYLYIFCILLLLLVTTCGKSSKGAQRWLNLGLIRFQPSEISKIAVPLIVARFINRDNSPPSFKNIILSLILICIPAILVAAQPDLGTAMLITISGLFVLFLAGISWTIIFCAAISVSGFIPVLWFIFMHNYQKDRVLMLLNPETDPLGAGYHIIQSKIAIGSGGLTGKGWLYGTQSQLEFLPERHTDFIFAVLGEELGLIGILALLILYISIIIRGLLMATRVQNTFGRVIVGSFMLIFFVDIFINIGMVSGILPVVGVPLPLISYGGSNMIILMSRFGITMSIYTHKKMLSKIL